MKMPGESLKSENSDPIPMAAAAAADACRPKVMKNAADNEQHESAVMKAKAKKNVKVKEMMMISNKANATAAAESKKACICICSPTSHAGSFRCHLHRCSASAAAANSTKGRENSTNTLKPNKKLQRQGHHPAILSRFGRASASLKLNSCSLSSQ